MKKGTQRAIFTVALLGGAGYVFTKYGKSIAAGLIPQRNLSLNPSTERTTPTGPTGDPESDSFLASIAGTLEGFNASLLTVMTLLQGERYSRYSPAPSYYNPTIISGGHMRETPDWLE